MPRKAKHPCHHPGCPKLTEGRHLKQFYHAKVKAAYYIPCAWIALPQGGQCQYAKDDGLWGLSWD